MTGTGTAFPTPIPSVVSTPLARGRTAIIKSFTTVEEANIQLLRLERTHTGVKAEAIPVLVQELWKAERASGSNADQEAVLIVQLIRCANNNKFCIHDEDLGI